MKFDETPAEEARYIEDRLGAFRMEYELSVAQMNYELQREFEVRNALRAIRALQVYAEFENARRDQLLLLCPVR